MSVGAPISPMTVPWETNNVLYKTLSKTVARSYPHLDIVAATIQTIFFRNSILFPPRWIAIQEYNTSEDFHPYQSNQQRSLWSVVLALVIVIFIHIYYEV